MNLEEEILSLKTKLGATILAHNYQIPPIQDLADFLGDSLELSIKATSVDNRTIVFCGVTFMAETAKILNPKKRVLIPRRDAICPMAEMAAAEEIVEARRNHPDAAVVSYVNTRAEVKAESDVCCTSANALKVVDSMEEDEIIFVPDMHLANYVASQTEKTIIPWGGYCYVHARILASEVKDAKALHPDARLLVHPECPTDIIELADEVLSTGGMVRYARESDAREFLIGTEEGLLYRLSKENPGKRFMPAGTPRTCTSMKKITLSDTYESLAQERYEVDLPDETMRRADRALRRMIDIS